MYIYMHFKCVLFFFIAILAGHAGYFRATSGRGAATFLEGLISLTMGASIGGDSVNVGMVSMSTMMMARIAVIMTLL